MVSRRSKPKHGNAGEGTSVLLRFAAYTFTVLIFTASLPAVADRAGIRVFMENGPLEWLQFALVVILGTVFLAGTAYLTRFRELFVLLACLAVVAAFRELDKVLDEAVPWVGWKIGFVVFLYALYSGYRNKRALKSQLPAFFTTRAFAVLWAGFLVALPIAQLVGHGPFLQRAMGAVYVYDYKHMIEEILELMGYILLVIGSIESVVQLRSARPDSLSIGAPDGETTAPAAPAAAATSAASETPAIPAAYAASLRAPREPRSRSGHRPPT